MGIVALAIAYSLLRKRIAAGTLNFYPVSVTDIHFEGITPIMTVGLRVQNTSNQEFILKSIAGNVYANNYEVGNISAFQPLPIPANSQTTILLSLRLSILGIVNDIIRAWETGNIHEDLEFDAYANVDGDQVPIRVKYSVGG